MSDRLAPSGGVPASPSLATPGGGVGASPLWTRGPARRLARGLPILTIVLGIVIAWYAAAFLMNAPFERDQAARRGESVTLAELVPLTMSQKRPVTPAPHQVAAELYATVIDKPITSKRSLVHHAWVTLSTTLLGFALGTLLGIALAIGIVTSRVLDKSLMPWIIASQTIPILAIAPMIIVVLNALEGMPTAVPKALIATYLSFFPVAVGMVKGLRSPDAMQLDLFRSWSASPARTLRSLRWPASVPFLFASMKVAIAIALVGAIVGELPTGAVEGLGARLLSGSYYGQTVQIWSAIIVAATCAGVLVASVDLAGRAVARMMGART